MRFLLDESVEYRLAAFLRQLGHDVTAIAHDYPGALKDFQVLALALEEGRILLTNDRDFGELVFKRRLRHSGVILFRLGAASVETKAERLGGLLAARADDLGGFFVVTPRSVRVRRS